MNGWKEGRNQGTSIQLALGAYYKQANLFQVHQTLFSIEKNVNAAWKMYLDIQCIFYIDPEPYQWQEIQRKVKSTLHTPMATEGVLEMLDKVENTWTRP